MGRPKNVARERTAARAAALLIRVVALSRPRNISRPRNLLWGFYSKDSARTGRQERVRHADVVTMAGMQRWVGLGVIADNLINIGRHLAVCDSR